MELKPRKITKAERRARIKAGIIRTKLLLTSPDVLDELVRLEEINRKFPKAREGILFYLLLGEIHPLRLIETIGWPGDNMSYSSIDRCIRDLKSTYPKEVFKEMDDAGIIDNFYVESCLNCDSHDNCHERPYKE